MIPPSTKFRTSDGYTLYRRSWQGEMVWASGPDPATADMLFRDEDGWPADEVDGRMEGEFLPDN